MEEAEHFFHGRLIDLREAVNNFVRDAIEADQEP